MTIGFLQLELMLPDTKSLKDKRSIISRIKNQIKNRFNVSIAEIGYGDKWGRSLVGITTISNDSKIVYNTLRKIEEFIESNFNVQVTGRKVELL